MTTEDVILSLVVVALIGLVFWVYRLGLKMSAPRELTDKAVEVKTLAERLSQEVSALRGDVGNIREHSARIAELSGNYEKTEQKVQTIYSILIGSYSKGKTGEQLLKNMMTDLVRAGFVETGARFGTQVVEYAVRFPDGKLLAIDSKISGTSELVMLDADDLTEEERRDLERQLVVKLVRRVDEVACYIDPSRTLPFALMAIPDSLARFTPELIGDASRRNVIVASYSAVPSLVAYFLKVHSTYAIPNDLKMLADRLLQVQVTLNEFDDNYFANRFDRPLGMIQKATNEIRVGVSEAQRLVDPNKLQAPLPEDIVTPEAKGEPGN